MAVQPAPCKSNIRALVTAKLSLPPLNSRCSFSSFSESSINSGYCLFQLSSRKSCHSSLVDSSSCQNASGSLRYSWAADSAACHGPLLGKKDSSISQFIYWLHVLNLIGRAQ